MQNSLNPFKYKISGTGGFVLVLLVLVLIGLGERVLYDLSRFFVGPDFNYVNDLSTLVVHTIFVSILIIVAVVTNVLVSEKKEKYAVVLIPYFVMAVALTIQVAFEAAFYFYEHHTQLQFYLVMSALVIVSTALIYFVQKRYVPIETTGPVNSIFGSIGRIVLVAIGIIFIGGLLLVGLVLRMWR